MTRVTAKIFQRYFLGECRLFQLVCAGFGSIANEPAALKQCITVRAARYRDSYNLCVTNDFLDHLASQLRANKSAACRRAIQRILAVVKEKFAEGKYKNHVEAEADFRQLVDRDESCTG